MFFSLFLKVSLLVVVEIGVFPLICGWWLDICSLVRMEISGIKSFLTVFIFKGKKVLMRRGLLIGVWQQSCCFYKQRFQRETLGAFRYCLMLILFSVMLLNTNQHAMIKITRSWSFLLHLQDHCDNELTGKLMY